MLSLTFMWKAARADGSRAPAELMQSADAERFVGFFADTLNMGISHDEIVKTVRGGRSPGTFAHWQSKEPRIFGGSCKRPLLCPQALPCGPPDASPDQLPLASGVFQLAIAYAKYLSPEFNNLTDRQVIASKRGRNGGTFAH
jgi:hypothetical protein